MSEERLITSQRRVTFTILRMVIEATSRHILKGTKKIQKKARIGKITEAVLQIRSRIRIIEFFRLKFVVRNLP